ncbi:hypothetical protein [uncultured Gammaproteobacteria bacterium]|nr:hypothetical protein [uncultured Gammaproteobacteria bacterium]CAC9980530.1 hypothetical protein [uncultured Gammaproteobacteria bacterium]
MDFVNHFYLCKGLRLALVFIFLANNPSFYLGCLLYGNKKIKKPLKFPNNLSQTLFNLFTDKLTKKGMIGKNKHKFPNPKIEPPNPKNTNQNPKKPPHSSLASIKIQTIPPI